MNRRGRSNAGMWIALAAGAVFVLWFAVLIAPYADGGLPGILAHMGTAFDHPFDLQLCANTGMSIFVCMVIYALAVCLAYNPKNYRFGEEHGSARWGSAYALNRRLSNKKNPDENRILSEHVRITTDQRALNKNLISLVIGGSGSRKTRGYVMPNLLQCNSSFVVPDPKGELLRNTGGVFEHEGYKVRVFDLIEMQKSFRYNPFRYFRDDNDIQKFVTSIFLNTEDKTKHGGDQFWDDTAKLMLSAMMYLVWYECAEEEMNLGTVMDLIIAEDVPDAEDGEVTDIPSPTQLVFEDLRRKNPKHIAVQFFDAYRKGAGKTIKSFQESLLSRLGRLLIDNVRNLVTGDEMEIESLCEEKTALFIRMPDNDSSFNFLASALITQIFQLLMHIADIKYKDRGGCLPIPVHFMLEEFANITMPDDFQKWIGTIRSRGITVSMILQNVAQGKKIFPNDWESVFGMCDEIVYLGGNEPNTHKWISDMLGQETVDTVSYGTSRGRSGGSSKNEQNTGRSLLDPAEVRLKNRLLHSPLGNVILILADEMPVIDTKYDLKKHPRYHLTADSGAPIYDYASSDDSVFTPGAEVYVNEPGIPEDEIAGEFTFDPNAVIRVPIRQQSVDKQPIQSKQQKGKRK